MQNEDLEQILQSHYSFESIEIAIDFHLTIKANKEMVNLYKILDRITKTNNV